DDAGHADGTVGPHKASNLAGGEGGLVHRLVEGDAQAEDLTGGGAVGRRGHDMRSDDAELEGGDVAGDLTVDEVTVLVEHVGEVVPEERQDPDGVNASGCLRREADVELRIVRAGNGRQAGDGDLSVGAMYEHQVSGEGGGVDRLAEGESDAAGLRH